MGMPLLRSRRQGRRLTAPKLRSTARKMPQLGAVGAARTANLPGRSLQPLVLPTVDFCAVRLRDLSLRRATAKALKWGKVGTSAPAGGPDRSAASRRRPTSSQIDPLRTSRALTIRSIRRMQPGKAARLRRVHCFCCCSQQQQKLGKLLYERSLVMAGRMWGLSDQGHGI
jgi:hypothetical protein